MCLSSPDINVPDPSAAETGLQQMQMDELTRSREMRDLMEPFLLQQAGYRISYPDLGPRPTAPTEPGWGWGNIPDITQYNIDLQNYQNEMAAWQASADSSEPVITRLTEEERLGNMDEATRLEYERKVLALRGELPSDPGLENSLAESRGLMGERLSRQLGSGWENTTPGIQSLSEFGEKAENLRSASRRDDLTTMQGLYATDMMNTQNLNARLMGSYGGPNAGAMSSALQPYMQRAGMGLQANMANAQNQTATNAGIMDLAGTLGGMGLYTWG